MNVQLWILIPIKALLKPINLHGLTHAFLYIMDQVHVLHVADHDEEDFVGLLDHNIAMVEILHLLCGSYIDGLVFGRLMMYRLIKVVHTKDGKRLLLIIMNILLGQKILIGEKLVLVLVGYLAEKVVVVEVLGENDVEGPIIVIILHQLVAINHRFPVVYQVIFEQLEV